MLEGAGPFSETHRLIGAGRYRLIDRIGAGGMGEVWRARDEVLGRDVAIKLLPGEVAHDPERLDRFEREARAVAALDHPNVLAIHDFGSHDGQPFMVTELLEGQTLRDLIHCGGLTPAKTMAYAVQIAHGLAAAHERGVLHRDLKPTNLFVTRDGVVKILDFGLAKLTPATVDAGELAEAPTEEPATGVGKFMGTVGYTAPEQLRGLPADARSDVFAFGCVLHEMLAGSPPFCRATMADTIAAVLRQDPNPLDTSAGVLPPGLARTVRQCLEKRPEDRFSSAHDLALALEAVSGASSSALRRVFAARTPARKDRPWLLAILGVAAVAAVAVLLPQPVHEALEARLGLLPLPDQRRVAVLPFHCTGGGEQQALCEGLGDYVTARLGQLERLQSSLSVVPASEIRHEGVVDAASAQRALGATLVVTGSLQRVGGIPVVSTALIDVSHRRQLRATTVRWEQPGAASPDRLVDGVVKMLELEITPETETALRSGGTTVDEAASLYTQGLAYTPYAEARSALERSDQQQSLERSIALFNQALERDPHYALALAGLGEAYWRLYELTRRPEFIELAERHCQRALQENDLLAQVWVTLGLIHVGTGRAQDALGDFRRALDRDPANADARRERGAAFERLGRLGEAEASYRDALARRSDDWRTYSRLASLLRRTGRMRDAEKEIRRALTYAPDNARLWSNLGAVLYLEGRQSEAKQALQRSVELHPTGVAVSNLGTMQFFAGQYADAARTFERATALGARDYRLWRNLAAAYYWAPGQRQQAAAAYRMALSLGEEERRLDPHNAELVMDLADCSAMTGSAQKARALSREALAMEPGNTDLQLMAAGIHEHLGDRATALRLVAAALKAGAAREQIDNDPTFQALRTDPGYTAAAQATSKQ